MYENVYFVSKRTNCTDIYAHTRIDRAFEYFFRHQRARQHSRGTKTNIGRRVQRRETPSRFTGKVPVRFIYRIKPLPRSFALLPAVFIFYIQTILVDFRLTKTNSRPRIGVKIKPLKRADLFFF